MSELDKLGHSLAYESCVTFLESVCMSVNASLTDDEEVWMDAMAKVAFENEAKQLDDSLRYLEMRGLLERHPRNSTWIQVMDESEAKA